MSWIQKLSETYDQCLTSQALGSSAALPPLSHAIQQAHIEVVLDGEGNFRRARVISREDTVIPVTERSATARTSAVVPHPLCDHVKYCAGDYRESGKDDNPYFDAYRAQLKQWCQSPHSHPKAIAVLKYVERMSVFHDLVREGILPVDDTGRLLERASSAQDKPSLFRQLAQEKGLYKPQNALIRWVVESGLVSQVWKDTSMQKAWFDYWTADHTATGFCMVTGDECVLATKHPKGLRSGKDVAKLISWKKEEKSEFVYLGRFTDASQVVGVSREVSEKAHAALRWLIKRQGYRNGDQAIVTWAVAGESVPDPFQDSRALFLTADELRQTDGGRSEDNERPVVGDVGQAFARRLNKAIAGYRANLDRIEAIIVMALDSATPGRMAITFYRELTGSEFLDRVSAWHEACAWHQDFGRDPTTKKPLRFIGAPSPTDIAEAAFGRRLDTKLRKATVERLLPCIIDGRPLPRDLVYSTVRRACNRLCLEHWEWKKILGIACALYRASLKEGEYRMTLETERTSRDYLYGRLLAIAEHLEGRALYVSGEKRPTTAARFMQRFAERPCSTWRSIEPALTPYKTRLRAKRPPFLYKMEQLLDGVVSSFSGNDFLDDRRLSGEFLLGYHCQRQSLNSSTQDDSVTDQESADI